MDHAHQNHEGEDGNDESKDDGHDMSPEPLSALPAADKVARTAHYLASRLKKEQSFRHINVEMSTTDTPVERPNEGGAQSSKPNLVGDEAVGQGAPASATAASKLDVDSLTSDETEEETHISASHQTV